MAQYLRRWLVAVFLVAPVAMALVPVADRLSGGVTGPHANDPWWTDFLNMVGFYGGYVLVAATIGSVAHTALIRRSAAPSLGRQVTWGAVIGVLVLAPQAAMFGQDYWAVNVAVGMIGGAFYGLVGYGVDAPPA